MVRPIKGWLGASPDGWVVDPSHTPSNGIPEIKCPYSKAEEEPENMCKDENFYFRVVNGSLQLDKNHPIISRCSLN